MAKKLLANLLARAVVKGLTLWRPAVFVNSRTKTTRSHVALCARNSGVKSGTELFKGLKDTACLLVCT